MGQQKKRRLLRVGLAALALAAGAVLLLLLRPPCLILESTGYYCGACGVTRLVEELLQGHVEAAFRQNVYMFFVLPLAALWLVGEAVCYLTGRRPLWKRRWMQALLVCVAAQGWPSPCCGTCRGWNASNPTDCRQREVDCHG